MPKHLTSHQRHLYWRGLKCLTRRAATLKKTVSLAACKRLQERIRTGDINEQRMREWENAC